MEKNKPLVESNSPDHGLGKSIAESEISGFDPKGTEVPPADDKPDDGINVVVARGMRASVKWFNGGKSNKITILKRKSV